MELRSFNSKGQTPIATEELATDKGNVVTLPRRRVSGWLLRVATTLTYMAMLIGLGALGAFILSLG